MAAAILQVARQRCRPSAAEGAGRACRPTAEVRMADVCLRADDAVMIAALAAALVKTEASVSRAAAATAR